MSEQEEQRVFTLTKLQKQIIAESIKEQISKQLWRVAANHLGAYLLDIWMEEDIKEVFKLVHNDFYQFDVVPHETEKLQADLKQVLFRHNLEVEHGEKAKQLCLLVQNLFDNGFFSSQDNLDTGTAVNELLEHGFTVGKPCVLLRRTRDKIEMLVSQSTGTYKVIFGATPEGKRITSTKIDQIYKVKHHEIDIPLYIIQIGTKYLIGDKKTIINELQKESRIEQNYLPLLEQLLEEPYNHGKYTTVQYTSRTWYIEEAPQIRIYDPYDLRGKLLKESGSIQKIDYLKLILNYFSKNKPEVKEVALDQLTRRTNFTETIRANFDQFTKGFLYLYSPQENAYYILCKQTNFSQIVTPEVARNELVPLPGWQALKRLVGFKAGSYKAADKRIDYFKFTLTQPL